MFFLHLEILVGFAPVLPAKGVRPPSLFGLWGLLGWHLLPAVLPAACFWQDPSFGGVRPQLLVRLGISRFDGFRRLACLPFTRVGYGAGAPGLHGRFLGGLAPLLGIFSARAAAGCLAGLAVLPAGGVRQSFYGRAGGCPRGGRFFAFESPACGCSGRAGTFKRSAVLARRRERVRAGQGLGFGTVGAAQHRLKRTAASPLPVSAASQPSCVLGEESCYHRRCR